MAFLENDEAEMARQVAWATGKTEEWDILMGQAEAAAFRGQLKKSRDFARQAEVSARKNNLTYALGNISGVRCFAELWIGDVATARQQCAESLKYSDSEASFVASGSALAGDVATAQTVVAQQSTRHPKNSLLNRLWLPQIKAAIEIKRGNPAAAVETIGPESNYETNDVTSRLIRGLALLDLHKAPEAALQFQSVIKTQGRSPSWIGRCIARLQHARALAIAGDNSGARSVYQDFLVLWKDADPDLPLLKQAKNEYAKLTTN
ncbi:MAG TPA: hypothetical protein VHR84_03830 [Terriglobales bacterium]|nr:hypothetical protein [Terriglobales bacterium]